jgi:hypothetical protein
MGRRCRPGRPRKDEAGRDPLADSVIPQIAGLGLIDGPQRQAAETYVFLYLLVHGAPAAEWLSDIPPRARLAELIEERCPALFGLAESDGTFGAGRYPVAAGQMSCEAHGIARMWPPLDQILLGLAAPAFFDASRPARAFDALQNFKRGLNRLCKLFQIPRRDTEMMGEGP